MSLPTVSAITHLIPGLNTRWNASLYNQYNRVTLAACSSTKLTFLGELLYVSGMSYTGMGAVEGI